LAQGVQAMARRRLTRRQKERIRTIQEHRRQHLFDTAEQALGEGEERAPLRGRVIGRHGASLAVADRDGRLHRCTCRQHIGHPVCGDEVVWQRTGSATGVVTALMERSSVLSRPDYSGREKPLVANITQLVVVIAPEPAPSGYLIDQYLVTAERAGIDALIAVNKMDLLDQEGQTAFMARFARYPLIGYPLVAISAKRAHGLDPLTERLRGHTSILVGQSGVGKSSLVKALLPDQDIQVGRLSEATGLGRHTTSAATLYWLRSGGELIDSPGVRSFRLPPLTAAEVERGFREFAPFLGRCRFKNCAHDQEPECALKEAVARGQVHPDRLANFRNMAAAASDRRQ
jgi:ribosome biogenesis GTPase